MFDVLCSQQTGFPFHSTLFIQHIMSQSEPRSPSNKPVLELLSNTKLSDIVQCDPEHIIVLKDTLQVSDAIHKLLSHGILSAPVVSMEQDGKIIGSLDLLDFIAKLMEVVPNVMDVVFGQSSVLEATGLEFGHKTIRELFRFEGRTKLQLVRAERPVNDAAIILATKTRRIGVVVSDSLVGAMFSQTNLVRFISEHLEATRFATVTVAEALKWVHAKPAVCVKSVWPMIKAIQVIHQYQFTSTPIVDLDGKLVGIVRPASMKRMKIENFNELRLNVQEYCERYGNCEVPPYVVSEKETLDVVTKEVARRHEHVAVVTNAAKEPTHVISLRDIIELLLLSDYRHSP